MSLMEVERSPILLQIVVDPGLCTLLIRAPWCGEKEYHIKGDKKGVYDLFADNLPGLPDNIRVSSDGGYWIAMAAVQKFPFSLLHYLGPYPSIRKSITKIVPQKMILKLLPKYSLLIKLDHRGDIIKSYHDPSGTTITEVSQAHEDVKERVLYLGSYQAKFIAKLKL